MMSAHGRTTRQNGVTISPPGSTSTNKFLPLPGTRNRLDLPTGCRSVSVRGGTAASVTLRDLAARAAHPVLRPTLVLIVDIRTIVLYSAAPVFGNLHLPCQQKTAFTQYGNQIRLATRPRWGRPMDAAAKHIAPQAQRYQRRRPEKTLWYRTVQSHFETWLALSTGQDDASPPAHVEQAFRRYLECGILANGFARAHCDECGHDFMIAFSCKGRGVCPSCNTRRMAETAAHLADHVFPRLSVRQWVLSVPKRLRYFLQRDTALQCCEFFCAGWNGACASTAPVCHRRM